MDRSDCFLLGSKRELERHDTYCTWLMASKPSQQPISAIYWKESNLEVEVGQVHAAWPQAEVEGAGLHLVLLGVVAVAVAEGLWHQAAAVVGL